MSNLSTFSAADPGKKRDSVDRGQRSCRASSEWVSHSSERSTRRKLEWESCLVFDRSCSTAERNIHLLLSLALRSMLIPVSLATEVRSWSLIEHSWIELVALKSCYMLSVDGSYITLHERSERTYLPCP